MDPRSRLRTAWLFAAAIAGGCTPGNAGTATPASLAFARQALRAVTPLIRVATPAPEAAATITMGVRG